MKYLSEIVWKYKWPIIILVVFVFSINHAYSYFLSKGDQTIRVLDGDTVEFITDVKTKVRIKEHDSFEKKQICLDKRGKEYDAGQRSTDFFISLLEKSDNALICDLGGRDMYGRVLGVCKLDGQNISEWMISEGWATAYVSNSKRPNPRERELLSIENKARLLGKGAWSGVCEDPKTFRRKKRIESLEKNG